MTVDRAIRRVAIGFAILGALSLAVIIVVTVISIIGRALIFAGFSPILGDYEIVEAGTGFAIFCFLPWCQLSRGHAIIDVLTRFLGPVLVRWIDALAEVLMAAMLAIIAWRLTVGFEEKLLNGETTFIRQFPLWALFGICLPPAYVSVLTALYTSAVAVKSAATGRDILPPHQSFE